VGGAALLRGAVEPPRQNCARHPGSHVLPINWQDWWQNCHFGPHIGSEHCLGWSILQRRGAGRLWLVCGFVAEEPVSRDAKAEPTRLSTEFGDTTIAGAFVIT
jgi:hypothetical protein